MISYVLPQARMAVEAWGSASPPLARHSRSLQKACIIWLAEAIKLFPLNK